MLNEELKQQQYEEKSIGVYITAQDCLASPIGRSFSDETLGLGYFQVFIELLARKLASQIDELNSSANLVDRLVSIYQRKKDRVDEIVIKIFDLSESGRRIAAFSDFESQIEKSTTTKVGGSAGGEIWVKLKV